MSGSSESESEEDICTVENSFKTEDYVNRRAGHIAVGYENGAIVWAGYAEVPPYLEGHEYWPPGEIWHYSFFHNIWRKLTTSGDIPNRCSGAGGCVLDESLFVVAGFHQVFSSQRRESPENSDEEDENNPRIEISNRIWSLNLHSLVWRKLTPGGIAPLLCDKTTIWAHQNKVYLFGGFGPPPLQSIHGSISSKFQYIDDVSTVGSSIFRRGWSNQLVYYSSERDRWVWPDTYGSPPSPRAAHSSAVIRDKVYIFGGRHKETRLNDLHCLDLSSMHWTNILLPSDSPPKGRSWQSLTPLYTGKEEGGLILYGGFDNEMAALSDCWKLDLSKESFCWERQKQLEDGPRLWHAAVAPNQSTIMIIGGLTNNILAPSYVTKTHADKVIYLRVSPPSLLCCALEYIAKYEEVYRAQVHELPANLRKILEVRACGGA